MELQRRRQGSYGYAAKYQQNPAPSEGGIIKLDWLRRYSVLPESFDRVLLSFDFNHGATGDSASYSVLSAWGQLGTHLYLIDLERFKEGFPETMRRLMSFIAKHDDAEVKLVEYKAMGRSIAQAIERKIPSIIRVSPDKSKTVRLTACSPFIEAGGLWGPCDADFAGEFVYELCRFPAAANDDQVDVTTQVIEYALDDVWWDDASFGC